MCSRAHGVWLDMRQGHMQWSDGGVTMLSWLQPPAPCDAGAVHSHDHAAIQYHSDSQEHAGRAYNILMNVIPENSLHMPAL